MVYNINKLNNVWWLYGGYIRHISPVSAQVDLTDRYEVLEDLDAPCP